MATPSLEPRFSSVGGLVALRNPRAVSPTPQGPQAETTHASDDPGAEDATPAPPAEAQDL